MVYGSRWRSYQHYIGPYVIDVVCISQFVMASRNHLYPFGFGFGFGYGTVKAITYLNSEPVLGVI